VLYDLNNMLDKKFKPTPCQNVIVGNPNITGINQFHSNIKGNPNNNADNANIPTTNKIPPNTFSIFKCFVLYII